MKCPCCKYEVNDSLDSGEFKMARVRVLNEDIIISVKDEWTSAVVCPKCKVLFMAED